MAIRSGMTDLVSQFRSLVQESGTAIFTDDRIQQILDNNSAYFTQLPLQVQPYYLNGSVIYKDYYLPNKTFLEGTATTTNVIYTTQGTVLTNYTANFNQAKFIFSTDTRGSAFYITGRSFDLYKSVSEGWGEKAGYYSTSFDFKVEGRQYWKGKLIDNCLTMAAKYGSMANVVQHSIDRGDMWEMPHELIKRC
jgi:hypothetical protein